jgi:hypothetical protein
MQEIEMRADIKSGGVGLSERLARAASFFRHHRSRLILAQAITKVGDRRSFKRCCADPESAQISRTEFSPSAGKHVILCPQDFIADGLPFELVGTSRVEIVVLIDKLSRPSQTLLNTRG